MMSVKPSRSTLVTFFNETLSLNIVKVDDLGDGAAYCQLVDSIYGDLPMHRVKFNTRSLLDMEQNYKILQQAFNKHKIGRPIDHTRLMKCRLQDNLDFSQWLYQFWHESPHIEGYNPQYRRLSGGANFSKGRRVPSVTLTTKATAAPQPQATSRSNSMLSGNSFPKSYPEQVPEMGMSRTSMRSSALGVMPLNSRSDAAHQRIAALEEEVDELGKTIDVLMEERGLYYEKLLDIEQLMNKQIDKFYSTQGDTAAMDNAKEPMLLLIRRIQEILFSSPEGFQPQIRPENEPF